MSPFVRLFLAGALSFALGHVTNAAADELDPCTLLTMRKASTLLGVQAELPSHGVQGRCRFGAASPGGGELLIMLTHLSWMGKDILVNSFFAQGMPDAEEIRGVGQRATLNLDASSPPQSDVVRILNNDMLLELNVSWKRPADGKQRLTKAAVSLPGDCLELRYTRGHVRALDPVAQPDRAAVS